MGRIPDHIIEQVKDAADIVDVVGKHVQLKRSGSEFSGLCPFHDERTPSFGVNPSKGAFYCFGCGAGGSVVRFVMDFHNLTFPEAVKQLAKDYSVQIVEEQYDPQVEQRRKLLSQLKLCNRDAARWFHWLLMEHELGKAGRDYLRSREITKGVARRWELGFAPDGPMVLQWGEKKGYPADIMVQAGLAGYRDEDRPHLGAYPRFRDRLMFPLCNDQGEPVAFSGRLMDPDAKAAKYLNTPETPIFDKGKLFFGLHLSKRPILKAKSAIICEGQIDLIACFEAGIENVVAPLGTGFTPAHAKILKRHADEAILLNDSDPAGFKASVRAFGTLAGAGVQVRAGEMPPGEDPDSLLKKSGPEALRAIVASAKEFHDFQIDRRSAELDMTTVRDRIQLAREVARTAAQHSDKAAQDALINYASTRLRISPDEFRRLAAEEATDIRRSSRPVRGRHGPKEPKIPENEKPTTFPDRAIALLCHLVLNDPVALKYVRAQASGAALDQFPGGRLLLRILDGSPDPTDAEALEAFLQTLPSCDEKGIRLLRAQSLPQGGVASAEQALLRLHIRSLKARIAAAKATLDDPGSSLETQREIFEQQDRLHKELLDGEKRLSDTVRPAPPSGTPPEIS